MLNIKSIWRKMIDAAVVASVSFAMLAVSTPAMTNANGLEVNGAQSVLSSTPVSSADFTGDVIYQIITDRFYDGDPTNNDPVTAFGEYSSDKSNWQLYWGGDFAGVARKMSYLKNLGVGAIWISPPVKNISKAAIDSSGMKSAGYHGYWGMDYFAPDPHFGSWNDFDNMVKVAHANGIKVIMDWAANHTSPEDIDDSDYANNGALVKDGHTLAAYNDDPNGYFHHNGGVSNYNDRYESKYKNLFNLADLAQENPLVTQYLEDAIDTWTSHGVDGIRMDAVKHMSSGFLKSYADHVYDKHSVFIFGEWADTSSAPLWDDEVKFANNSGQSLENFDLNGSIRNVFISDASMKELNATLERQQSSFDWSNQLVNFVDGHDTSRFLSLNDNKGLFDMATVVNMTVPGIPSIYYGDEQYSHVDSMNASNQIGGDPYNRQAMPSFDENTRNFKITKMLSNLRSDNPALRYGALTERWLNDDVYVYERHFYNDAVLVAVNKGTTDCSLTDLYTSLPAGSYADALGGQLGGGTLKVSQGTKDLNVAQDYVLQGGQAAVWSFVESPSAQPQIGNVGPTMGHVGDVVSVTGKNFGTNPGTVTIGDLPASVNYWSDDEVDFTIPDSAETGVQDVVLTTAQSEVSNAIAYHVLTAPQTAVTFTVTDTSTSYGDQVYLTGNVPELGNWSTDSSQAVGPLVCPEYPTWFGMASVPAGTTIEYKYFVKKADGTIVWEGGGNHKYTVPESGTGSVTVQW
ncbi:alpha-amylase family glycosyl hydrolase [Bifidobacterium miconisargentati]|uniref:alpha-amylase family glycosyl hydrolase n=1 Tax=Bifidobacterium miconisargentati TaxID=2834437 RepID=UPI001BDC8793|nr:alpha-amylase family glycosyl hydrolase [Bifidobacterium miconisargentati]MBW3089153.1 IPT/TIG domain-containing protein [Bifidobacterium miconisargentati]